MKDNRGKIGRQFIGGRGMESSREFDCKLVELI
jgi:hypothetical protein